MKSLSSAPRRVLMGAVILVLLAFAWRGLSHRPAGAATQKPVQSINVETALAARADVPIYLHGLGTVQAFYTVTVTARVDGELQRIGFTEGQDVRKGDLLAEIDPRPNRAALDQAVATKAKDAALLANAKRDLERYTVLQPQDLASKQTVDTQRATVDQLAAQLQVDQALIDNARTQLEYTRIVSPINGRTGIRLVDPGNIVQANGTSALAVITQLQPITVIFTLPEDSLSPLIARLHDQAKLAVDVFDRSAQKKIASGVLLALDNQIDTTTGTVKVRAIFDNADNALFPNQFVNARLLVNTLHGVTLIPASALQQNGQSSFVYIIQNNVAHVRAVKPGVTDAGNTQVDDVKPGEIIANSSFDKLQDNARVSIVSKPAATGAPAAAPAAAAAAAPAAAPAASAAQPASNGSSRTGAP